MARHTIGSNVDPGTSGSDTAGNDPGASGASADPLDGLGGLPFGVLPSTFAFGFGGAGATSDALPAIGAPSPAPSMAINIDPITTALGNPPPGLLSDTPSPGVQPGAHLPASAPSGGGLSGTSADAPGTPVPPPANPPLLGFGPSGGTSLIPGVGAHAAPGLDSRIAQLIQAMATFPASAPGLDVPSLAQHSSDFSPPTLAAAQH